jgi:PAS domain S-box-containing protein
MSQTDLRWLKAWCYAADGCRTGGDGGPAQPQRERAVAHSRSMKARPAAGRRLRPAGGERRRGGPGLRDSDALFRALFDNEFVAICTFDPETRRFLDVNHAHEVLYGWSREELLGGMTTDQLTAEVEASTRSVEAVLRDGAAFVPLRWHRKTDGTLFPVQIVGGAYLRDGRRIAYGMVHDVTEQKRLDEELHQSEARLVAVLEGSSDGFVDIDVRRGMVYRSPRYWEIAGWPPGSLPPVSASFLELIHPEDADHVKAVAAGILAGTVESLDEEYRLRSAAGTWRWVRARIRIVGRDASGRPTRIAGTVSDTEDRRSRHQHELNEARLQGLTGRMNEAEFVVRVDGTILAANDRAFGLYGYAREEFVGLQASALRAPHAQRGFKDGPQRASGEALRYETEHLRRDGTSFPVEVSTRPFEVGGVTYIHALVRDLSEQRRQEAELRLLAGITSSMQDAVLLVDPGLRVIRYANAAEKVLGWPEAEVVGWTTIERFEVEFPDGDGEAHLARIRAREPSRVHALVTRKDGRRIEVDVADTPRFDALGQFVGYFALVRDVTARRAAERALQRSEERLRTVVTSMAEGLVMQDASGAIVTCNPAAERILGLSRDQMEGRHSVDPRWRSIHEDDSPFPGGEHPAMVTLRTGVALRNVVMGVHKPDGSLTWISIASEPLRVEPGDAPYAVITTFSDITAVREVAARLEETSQRLTFVLDGSNDGYWDCHLPSGHVLFSERWAAMFGYEVAELEPSIATSERMTHPEDAERCWTEFRRYLAGEVDRLVVEARVRHKDGRWVWVLVRGKVVERDAAGAPLRASGTYTDISERKAAEEAMRSTYAENAALVEELREAIASVRTLTGFLPICMFCKKIRDDKGYWEQIERYIATHADVRFSHGLCPECREKHFPRPEGAREPE